MNSCRVLLTANYNKARSLHLVPLWFRRNASTAQSEDSKEPPVSFQDARPMSDIPGAKGLPLVGTLFGAYSAIKTNTTHRYIADRQRQYGPIVREKNGPIESVIISDPEDIKSLFQHDAKYPERMDIAPWVWYKEKNNLKKGVFFAKGEEWQKHRTALNRDMMRPKTVSGYTDTLNGVVDDMVVYFDSYIGSEGEVVDLEGLLLRWSLESACTVLFERRLGCLMETPPEDVQEFIHATRTKFVVTSPLMAAPVGLFAMLKPPVWKSYLHAENVIHETSKKYIYDRIDRVTEELKKDENIPGLSASLVKQKALSHEEIYASLVDLMGAAVDTTSTSALWCLYLLAKHPEKQERCYDELARILPAKGKDAVPNEDAVKEMRYVKAIIKESLRLYPTLSFGGRVTDQDLVMKGYQIPKGTIVSFNLFAMGRDPDLYHDPKNFTPERWLRDSEEKEDIHPFSSLPFSFGPRACIGRRLAELEMELLLARVVNRYRLELLDGDVKDKLTVILVPDKPVRIKLTARS